MNWYCYLKVKGSSQGPFKSENPHGRKGAHLGYAYEFDGFVADDPARGAASATTSHKPFRVVKGRDVASPQFSKAFWNKEVLDEVVLEIVETSGKGEEDALKERYTLMGATVATLRRTGGPRADQLPDGPLELEEIGFRFERAKHESADGKTIALYDFKNQGAT